jgi:RNA polymerase sigma-70 factor (ECF subfamily)
MSSVSRTHPDPLQPVAATGEERPDDATLFRRARSGDRGAFGSLVLMYQDRVYNMLVRMVGDREEARELAQEAFTRALMKLSGFRGEAQPCTWIFRIAINLAISRLRKVRRRRIFSLDQPDRGVENEPRHDQASGLVQRLADDGSSDPADVVERRERDQQVLAALGRVDPEHRALLVMRDIEGFDYQQMADLLELPLGTLKSRLFRARRALLDELRDYFGPDIPG